MKPRAFRRHKISSTERIAYALEGIRRVLYELSEYARAHEDRQKIYADIFAGFMPVLQKYVADILSPKHPTSPRIAGMLGRFPRSPKPRRANKKKN